MAFSEYCIPQNIFYMSASGSGDQVLAQSRAQVHSQLCAGTITVIE